MPEDDPIIMTEPATAAKVLLPPALMEPHDAVHTAAQQLGDVQIGTETRSAKRISFICSNCQSPCADDLVMVLVVWASCRRFAVQAEKADHFDWENHSRAFGCYFVATGAVGSGIWHP